MGVYPYDCISSKRLFTLEFRIIHEGGGSQSITVEGRSFAAISGCKLTQAWQLYEQWQQWRWGSEQRAIWWDGCYCLTAVKFSRLITKLSGHWVMKWTINKTGGGLTQHENWLARLHLCCWWIWQRGCVCTYGYEHPCQTSLSTHMLKDWKSSKINSASKCNYD